MNRRRIVAVLALAAAGWLARRRGAAPPGSRNPPRRSTDLDAFMAKRARAPERELADAPRLHPERARDVPDPGPRRHSAGRPAPRVPVVHPRRLSRAQPRQGQRRLARRRRPREVRERLAGEGAGPGAASQGEGGEEGCKAAKQGADSVEAEVVKELRIRSNPESDKEVVAMVGSEPRFISEAYFMKFPFEPGNYYLAGRETIDGRPVVKVEYYPSRLFSDDEGRREEGGHPVTAAKGDVKVEPAGREAARQGASPKKPAKRDKGDEMENEIERAMNKVTMVTMWIDPAGAPDRQVHLRQRRLGLPAGPRHRPRGPGEGVHDDGALLRQRVAAEGDRVQLRRDLRGRVATRSGTRGSSTTIARARSARESAATCRRSRNVMPRPIAVACSRRVLLLVAGWPHARPRPPGRKSSPRCASTATTARPTRTCCGSRAWRSEAARGRRDRRRGRAPAAQRPVRVGRGPQALPVARGYRPGGHHHRRAGAARRREGGVMPGPMKRVRQRARWRGHPRLRRRLRLHRGRPVELRQRARQGRAHRRCR